MATTDSRARLELARDRLLARLHARSDDYAATRELQRVSQQLAAFDSADDDQTRRVGQSGLSFFDRLRARWHRGSSRGGASR